MVRSAGRFSLRRVRRWSLGLGLSILAGLLAVAPLGSPAEAREAKSEGLAGALQGPSIAERWGVEVEGIRLSAASYMLDFRYTVIDAEKARPLFKRQTKPVLIDEASGERFIVPAPPKTGPLRNSNMPKAGRTYGMLFANPGKFIKPGNRVTVVIGDFRAGGIVVE